MTKGRKLGVSQAYFSDIYGNLRRVLHRITSFRSVISSNYRPRRTWRLAVACFGRGGPSWRHAIVAPTLRSASEAQARLYDPCRLAGVTTWPKPGSVSVWSCSGEFTSPDGGVKPPLLREFTSPNGGVKPPLLQTDPRLTDLRW